jgi:hypothetical protein
MLRISKEQMRVFERVAIQDYENRLVEYVRAFFPDCVEALGEAAVREFVRRGRKRAEEYHFVHERSVRLFISLLLMIGNGFDRDPQLPWAREILEEKSSTNETERIDRLYGKAMEYFDAIAGIHDEKLDEPITRIRGGQVGFLPPPDSSEFHQRMEAWLNSLSHEKCQFVGDACLRRLIHQGIQMANGYGITNGRGVAIYVSCMFILGSGFDEDLLFAWAAEILRDKALSEVERTELIYERCKDPLRLIPPALS